MFVKKKKMLLRWVTLIFNLMLSETQLVFRNDINLQFSWHLDIIWYEKKFFFSLFLKRRRGAFHYVMNL